MKLLESSIRNIAISKNKIGANLRNYGRTGYTGDGWYWDDDGGYAYFAKGEDVCEEHQGEQAPVFDEANQYFVLSVNGYQEEAFFDEEEKSSFIKKRTDDRRAF